MGKCVTPYAIFITLAQLMQMIVGMYVTIKAVFHQTRGEECHVNKTNSVLGLVMYFSYFVLFFKLFVDNYCCKSKDSVSLPRKPSVALDLVRTCGRERDSEENRVSWRSPAVLLCIFFFMLRMLLSLFDLFLLSCNDEFDVSHILSCWQQSSDRA